MRESRIVYFIKKVGINILYWIFQLLIASKKLLFFLCVFVFQLCVAIATFFFRHPAIFLYRLLFKTQSRISSLGIDVKHPFLYLISGKFINHALIIALGGILIGAALQSRLEEVDIGVPHNILSHFIAQDEETQIEEGSGSLVESPTSGQIGAIARNPVEEPESRDAGTPGDIAQNSGALIKPTLPITSDRIEAPNTLEYYTIQSGDTLANIARHFGLKIATLLYANDLSGRQSLRIGQRLAILPMDGVLYRVRRGDTIGMIAKNYGADIDKILAFNNISIDRLRIGAELIIPDGVPPPIYVAEKKSGIFGKLKKIFAPEKERNLANIPSAIVGAAGMIWPTTARRITQYFNWHHTGVDIAGPTSNTIMAAASGVVEIAGWQRGYGNTILLRHPDGKKTRYGHASRLYVGAGESVKKGQVIAQVGSTGHSTGPHLHFEVLVGGRRVNPFLFIH